MRPTRLHASNQCVVERWNAALAAGRGTLWSPTICAALL
jgi:hypothetical protein